MRHLTVAMALWAASLSAQMPEPLLRTTTRLVQINVIVTKHGGAPVPGLKKEDFQVFDNGKRQEIRQFSEETRAILATAAPLPQGTFTNQIEQRSGTPAAVTAILLDGVNTRFSDQAYARQQVIRFLKQIQPEDRIAIYTLDSRGLRVLHDYTTDSSDLVTKLAKYPGDIAADVTGQSEVSDLLGGWLTGSGSSAERAFFLNERIQLTLNAIEFIANNLATLPGRKNLIWVSAAFPLQIGFLNYFRIGRRPRWNVDGRPGRSGRACARAEFSQRESGAADLDGGGRPGRARPEQRQPGNLSGGCARPGGLRLVARSIPRLSQPGDHGGTCRPHRGRAFINTNDIAGAIRTAVEDSSVTYTLGFYPQNDKFDNSFHTLKVKLVEFPHMDLRYRRGIWTRRLRRRTKSCGGRRWLTRW